VKELVTPWISCVGYKFEFACKAKTGSEMHGPMYLWGCSSETDVDQMKKRNSKSQRKLEAAKTNGSRADSGIFKRETPKNP